MLTRLANPSVFLRWSGPALRLSAALGAGLLGLGLYLAWFVAPADYQQGETVRIMFVHVPAAWLALFLYALMARRRSGRWSGAIRWPTWRRRRRRRSGPPSR